MRKRILIVLASGTGSRYGSDVPKQFLELEGRTVLERTLDACDNGLFDSIVLVVSFAFIHKAEKLLERNCYTTPVRIVAGGLTRKESCRLGVRSIDVEDADVVIHNGVQPFVTREVFERCLSALETFPAVTSGVPCVYTVLRVDGNESVIEMPDRATLRLDMGVECFRLPLLRELFAKYDDTISTDIIGMVFRSGLAKVHIVEGDPCNIKITRPEDMALASHFIKERGNG